MDYEVKKGKKVGGGLRGTQGKEYPQSWGKGPLGWGGVAQVGPSSLLPF